MFCELLIFLTAVGTYFMGNSVNLHNGIMLSFSVPFKHIPTLY